MSSFQAFNTPYGDESDDRGFSLHLLSTCSGIGDSGAATPSIIIQQFWGIWICSLWGLQAVMWLYHVIYCDENPYENVVPKERYDIYANNGSVTKHDDFMPNYMDVMPFDLSCLALSSSPRPSPPPPTPPTRAASPASSAVSEWHMSTPSSLPQDTDWPGIGSEDTDVGSCSYESGQGNHDGDSPLDSPAVSLIEEEEKKEEDVQVPTYMYELRSNRGGRSSDRGADRGRGSGAISPDPLDEISVIYEERVTTSRRGVSKHEVA